MAMVVRILGNDKDVKLPISRTDIFPSLSHPTSALTKDYNGAALQQIFPVPVKKR